MVFVLYVTIVKLMFKATVDRVGQGQSLTSFKLWKRSETLPLKKKRTI